MIEFTKPNDLDGFYLRKELSNAGVVLLSDSILVVENSLFLDIDSQFEKAAQSVIDAHEGNVAYLAEQTAIASSKAALLDRLGITELEAKLLLS